MVPNTSIQFVSGPRIEFELLGEDRLYQDYVDHQFDYYIYVQKCLREEDMEIPRAAIA